MKKFIVATAAALMLAVGLPGVAKAASSGEFLLLAAGEVGNVLPTTFENQPVENNGSYWYLNGLSMGFAPNNVIKQNQADVCKSPLDIHPSCDVVSDDGSERFSLHTFSDFGGNGG
jgi:hypothetical protein